VAVALVATALVACVTTTAAPPADAALLASAGPTCGFSRTLRTASGTWTCTFDDEFTANKLDTTKWGVQTTATSGWTTADTCYVDSPSTVSQSRGALHLTAYTAATATMCGSAYATRHLGGAVMSYTRFAQTYGRFEIRARFPATTQAGFWSDLWLYPQDMAYGAWPRSGEIDIAEYWTGHSPYVLSALHYDGSGSADSRACTVSNPAAYHTYALEWGPSTMTFLYDGKACFTRSWVATTGSAAPFDRPFFLLLSEGFGDPSLPISSLLPASGPVDIDYVRVYS
jgi:beta-glucanase (GH16 family)